MNWKVFVPALLILFVSISAVLTGILYVASEAADDLTNSVLAEKSMHRADEIKAGIEHAKSVARILHSSLSKYIGSGATRNDIIDELNKTLLTEPHLFGVFTLWEPDAFDAEDSEYIGKLGGDTTGRFNYYYYRGNTGYVSTTLRAHNERGKGDYYQKPKKTGTEYFMIPYTYELSDHSSYYMMSASVPFMIGGEFMGVVGVDMLMNSFTCSNSFPFESGYLFAINSNGTIIYHPETEYINGYLYDFIKGPESLNLKNMVEIGEKGALDVQLTWMGEKARIYIEPMWLGDLQWSVCSVVPISEIRASSLRMFTIAGILCLFLIAAIIIALLLFSSKVTKPMLAVDSAVSSNGGTSDMWLKDGVSVSEQCFHDVIGCLPAPVLVVDLENTRISYSNDSMQKLLEYGSADELTGRPLRELWPEILIDGTPAHEHIPVVLKDSGVFEANFVTKTGKTVEALICTIQVCSRERKYSVEAVCDLTAERAKQRELASMAEREKQANREKSLFLANMSHEIRTPMNGIIGMADLLLCENLNSRQMQYVKDVKTAAESLLGIINDILDLSKIGAGKLLLSIVDVDLNALLRNVASMMRFSVRAKGLDFIQDIRLNTPEYVRIDDMRLHQIIVNLLSNAVKFTKAGSIKLSARIDDNNIVISVSDTGIGIKREDIPYVFNAYEQADKRANRSIRGTGLGLSISKSLTELMGGDIRFESRYGAGTTFFLTLPYVPGDADTVETQESEFKYIFAPSAKVLLVDDIQTNLTVCAGLLRLCGITADVALSGREALELIKRKDYDIVFMDHIMPDLDGVQSLQLIRDLGEKYQKLPVIALTANAVSDSRETLMTAGMDDFLSKPIDKVELMEILRKWLPAQKIETRKNTSETGLSVSYTEALEAAANIEGLDIELALSRISGMSDVLESSIKQVAYSLEDKLKKMDDCLSGGDLRNLAVEAHGLKGALANIGATNNSELAAELEIAAKAENMLAGINKFAVFASVIEKFAHDLKSVFPEDDKKTGGDSSGLYEAVSRALRLTEDFEASEASAILSEFRTHTYSAEIDEALTEAGKELSVFNYEAAAAALRKLLKITGSI